MTEPTKPISPSNSTGSTVITAFGIPTYEEQLNRDPRWALSEGSRHFEESSAVFDALRKITSRLNEFQFPYAVVGGMALFRHGLRRFTEDVDILVAKHDLRAIHDRLTGLGYLPPHPKSKHLRDTELGVRIEFLTSGDFPGDGRVKPVAFPDPDAVSFEAEGIHYIQLPQLIELKLASGMTNASRMKDLSDVLELIKLLDLPQEYADRLNPFVQDKFGELWKEARKRYVLRWRTKGQTPNPRSIDELIRVQPDHADLLEQMQADGIELDHESGTTGGYALLVTTDRNVAEKYGLVEESEYWDIEDDGDENPRAT